MLIDPSNSHCQFIIGDSEPFFIRLYSLTVLLKSPHQELEDLIKKIKTRLILSPEAEEFLYSISKEKTLRKGEVLIRQGQVVKNTFFVSAGCLRSYCTDKNGKENTLLFAIKDWWISDYIAIHTDELATLTVECLTESKVIEFNAKELDGIHSLFPEFEPYQRHNLERHVVSLHRRILNQLQLSLSLIHI